MPGNNNEESVGFWKGQSQVVKLCITAIIILSIALIITFLFAFGSYTAALKMGGLDNRPRWMMGGLRDDTGSHNAKDVFGMGFGLDQTRVGTATVDGQYNLRMGQATMPLGDKLQGEYGNYLGQ